MTNQANHTKNARAINKNKEIRKVLSVGDKISDTITSIAGSVPFLLLNVTVFIVWLLVNTGQFGADLVFDKFPFGLLTTSVSLEAIILAVFVLITQNRQAAHSDMRSELDYVTDLHADADLDAIFSVLKRVADKQGIDVSDVVAQLDVDHAAISNKHQVIDTDAEN